MGSASTIIELDWDIYGEPSQLSQCFCDQPGFAWLDSASTFHPNSRYHILAWLPLFQVQAIHGNIQLRPVHSTVLPVLPEALRQQPFEALNHLAQQVSWQSSPDCTLPFQGGWLGYWGYDLGRYIECLPHHATSDIELADIELGWYAAAVIIDQQEKRVQICGTADMANFLAHQIHSCNISPSLPFRLTTDWSSNMTQASYTEKFHCVQDYLLAGDCYQVNLAQRYKACFTGSPLLAYLALRQKNAGPFSAFIHASLGHILCVSPERFILAEQGHIETKPIKGTRPRSPSAQLDQEQKEQLQQAEKDRAENLMIVDLLRNDLGKVAAPGSVKVPELFAIESFPAVHHLVSTVTALLDRDKNVYSLLAAAFPGGSITGAPKLRAMEIIEELEPHRRSVYCGAIGYISVHGRMDTNIAIRTLLCSFDQHIYCWAGGGLVADSHSEAEYQETHDKLSQILPILSAL